MASMRSRMASRRIESSSWDHRGGARYRPKPERLTRDRTRVESWETKGRERSMAALSTLGSDGRDFFHGLRRAVAVPTVIFPAMIFAAMYVTGCVTPPEGIRTVEGEEQDDIPVPRTFELQHSYPPASAAENNFRSWHGYYRGRGTQMEIAAWYVSEMPKHGWVYKEMAGDHDRKHLHFVKGEERARIELYDELDPKEGMYLSMVHAEIHPLGPEEVSFEDSLMAISGGSPQKGGEGPKARLMPASATVGNAPAVPAPAMKKAGSKESVAPTVPSGKPERDALEEEIKKFEDGE
jgi:hypothetical protein